MGSPLSPMAALENRALQTFPQSPKLRKRFVDDNFCAMATWKRATYFLSQSFEFTTFCHSVYYGRRKRGKNYIS